MKYYNLYHHITFLISFIFPVIVFAQTGQPRLTPGRLDSLHDMRRADGTEPNRAETEERTKEGGNNNITSDNTPLGDAAVGVGGALLLHGELTKQGRALTTKGRVQPDSKLQQHKGARCSTPQQAIDQLLYWLQPERLNKVRAAACLNREGIRSGRLAVKRAGQILTLLDAQGLYVEVKSLPNDPNYMDTTGRYRYQLFSSHPEVYVEKIGDRWLWSGETISRVEALLDQIVVFDLDRMVSSMPPTFRRHMVGLFLWQWIGIVVLLGLGHLLRIMITHLVAHQGRRLIAMTGATLAEKLLLSTGRPVGVLGATVVMAILLPSLELPVVLSRITFSLLHMVAAVASVLAVYQFVDLFTAWLTERAALTQTKLDDQLVPLLRKAMKIVIVLFGGVFILQNIGVEVGGLLASMGLGGLAVALAAKDTIANLFGSATIFTSRPFQIGDWVYIDGTEGVVETVGFRSTRVRTFYNSLISIPNNKVADAVVDNYGARKFRRCKTMLSLTYDTSPEQMESFVNGVQTIVKDNPHTCNDNYEIHFYNYSESSLDVLLYFFFEVESWSIELRERQKIFLAIMKLAKDIGVSFAFPTRTLHLSGVEDAKLLSSPLALAKPL